MHSLEEHFRLILECIDPGLQVRHAYFQSQTETLGSRTNEQAERSAEVSDSSSSQPSQQTVNPWDLEQKPNPVIFSHFVDPHRAKSSHRSTYGFQAGLYGHHPDLHEPSSCSG